MATTLGVTITDPDGTKHRYTLDEAVEMGYKVEDLTTGTAKTAYKTESGGYSPFISQSTSPVVSLDKDSGKISVTVPDEWKDDDYVKKLTDSSMLTSLSRNYKTDDSVKYQDPYDETKQVTTEEYIAKINDGLKSRYAALEATAPTKANLISRFGGNAEKNNVINSMTTEDIIVMSTDTSADDSWVPLPEYMLIAYPQLKDLSTFKNGYVQKKDFLENFYDIESGAISERNAYGIATTPEKMLAEIEDMTPEEVAKTIAFWGVVDANGPKRSGIDTFLRGGSAMATGFYGGLYDWATDNINLMVNVAKLSWWTGGVDAKSPLMENAFMEGAGLSSKKLQETLTTLSYTDPNAAAALQAGYQMGEYSGKAIDYVLTMVAFGEASRTITEKIVEKGAAKTAVTIAEQGDLSAATGISTAEQAAAANLAATETTGALVKKLYASPAAVRTFFSQTMNQAEMTFYKALGGTSAVLNSMAPSQLITVVESAFSVAKTAALTNTALGVLSNLVLGAVVENKQLAVKVLSGSATDSETVQWIQTSLADAAKLTAFSALTGVGAEALGRAYKGTEAEAMLNDLKQMASKAATKTAKSLSAPWLKFQKWYLGKKEIARQVSNATAKSAEAVREAILVNEARAYTAGLSTIPTPATDVASTVTPGAADTASWLTFSDFAKGVTKAGIIFNPTTGEVSPFMAGQAAQLALENRLTDWGDITTSEMVLMGELTNPDIEPVISQQLSEVSDASTELYRAEVEAGLISKETFDANKPLAKETSGMAFAYHSREAAIYAVRSQELQLAIDKANADGISLAQSPEYKEAKAKFDKAARDLSDGIKSIIDNKVLPSLRVLEHSLIDRMTNDWGIYPKDFVAGLRASGEYGKDGQDWLRLVARKDLPQGVYMPYSHVLQRDYTIDLKRSKILDDDDITWVGNGLYELVRESALARTEKNFLDEAKKATGLQTEVVVSGKKTAAARTLGEYKTDLNNAINNGLRSFVEDISMSSAIGKKKDIALRASQKEAAHIGGTQTMDIGTLRATMQDHGVPSTSIIENQETLSALYDSSSKEGKKILASMNPKGKKPSYEDYLSAMEKDPEGFVSMLEKVDRANAQISTVLRDNADINTASDEFMSLWQELSTETSGLNGTSFEVQEKAKKGKKGSDALKYDIDGDMLASDIEYAIDGVLELTEKNKKASLAIGGVIDLQEATDTAARRDFVVLDGILSKDGKKLFKDSIKGVAKKIVDANIPKTKAIIKGNLDSLYKKVETALYDGMERRLALLRATLLSNGEVVDSQTVTELLDKYREEIFDAKADPLVVKTTDTKGEIIYERVSPAIADIYNNRPIYTPVSTPMQTLANLALLKRISTTNLNPRSFSKQAASDTALAFATTGALPGTLHAMQSEIAIRFGSRIANEIAKNDPSRYRNIEAIASREGISIEEAAMRNVNALGDLQLPFTTINQEALRQADVAKYGNKVALEKQRKTVNQKLNDGLKKASDKLGRPNDKREEYTRRLAGERAFLDALDKGFSYDQAETFRRYAQDNATTNFRQKSTVFNNLRTTTPYLTSGISGAKSFWKMFQLDPIGVSARIFTGFVVPIMYFMGEIMDDEELRKKYDALAEYEKDNHIIVAVGGELIRIPVGEELGGYTNLITHIVEAMHGTNKYDFWLLMLNDVVGLYPTLDLTGFTDPAMWQPISGEAPSFLEVMDNGISAILAQTMPPIAQSLYMVVSGRDLYTGKKVNTGYITIDDDGNAVVMSYSQSQFAKTLANLVGGDARVIEKVTSGIVGTTALHVLDTLTSAAQYVSSGGEEGSLTTAAEKALSDISNPYTAVGYDSLESRWNSAVSALYDKKKAIEDSQEYQAYNQKISSTRDAEERQKLINKRNDLLSDYQNQIEALVKGFRGLGGELNKKRFSTAVSLLTFEDALRADRAYMGLNTTYSNAYAQALQTLNSFGITNPDGVSMLGYIHTDSNGDPQLKVWTPAQIQIISNAFYAQGDAHQARIEAIINDGTENSLSNQLKAEKEAENAYWNKGTLTDADYDAIDDLRKAYNVKVVKALKDYMDAYGAAYVLSSDAVMDYLEDIIRVPSSYETIKGRYVSSGGGKLNKQQGFAESYIKSIFGVK